MPPITRALAAADAPTLLDALAHAPAAAALVVGALKRAGGDHPRSHGDRKALRLVCTQLRDAVDEATTWLEADFEGGDAAPPTPARWPRVKELRIIGPTLEVIVALGSETWGGLRTLRLGPSNEHIALDVPSARALAAALRRMPALRALKLRRMRLSDEAAAELFRASSAEDAPQLRLLAVTDADVSPAAVGMLAAAGWPLEELDLRFNDGLGAAHIAALLAAPAFALRRLATSFSSLDAASLLALANAPWPLEELDFTNDNFRPAEFAPALAALSRLSGLRKLILDHCALSAAAFKALVEAEWPALTHFSAQGTGVKFDGPDALGAAAFAGFSALEELDLSAGIQIFTFVPLGVAGARLLASQRWARLRTLNLSDTYLGDAGVAVLARGEWPALKVLKLERNDLGAAALISVANAPWPLEELDLSRNDLSAAAAGPALVALSRRGLRRLEVRYCKLSAATFKALVEAAWPSLTCLKAIEAEVEFDGPHALGAAAFAGFPALEELVLKGMAFGDAGARLLARRRWPRLRVLNLKFCHFGDDGAAALGRAWWPALEFLVLWGNGVEGWFSEGWYKCTHGPPWPLHANARRRAPALVDVIC